MLTVAEALRFIALGTLLVHFCRQPTRISRFGPDAVFSWQWISANLAAILLAIFLFHTLAVLLVSLPPSRAPPQNQISNRFFTADMWRLARHVAELLATVLLLGARWIYGDLPLSYFMPVGLVALLPLGQLLLWYRPADCCKEAALMLGCLVSAPWFLAVELMQRAWQCRLSFCNPRHGPLHLLLALLACPLALMRWSRKPALALYAIHGLIMAVLLLERALRCDTLTQAALASRCCCCCGILKVLDRTRPTQEDRQNLTPINQIDAANHVVGNVRESAWRPGKTWFFAVLVALEAFSLAVEQKWVWCSVGRLRLGSCLSVS